MNNKALLLGTKDLFSAFETYAAFAVSSVTAETADQGKSCWAAVKSDPDTLERRVLYGEVIKGPNHDGRSLEDHSIVPITFVSPQPFALEAFRGRCAFEVVPVEIATGLSSLEAFLSGCLVISSKHGCEKIETWLGRRAGHSNDFLLMDVSEVLGSTELLQAVSPEQLYSVTKTDTPVIGHASHLWGVVDEYAIGALHDYSVDEDVEEFWKIHT